MAPVGCTALLLVAGGLVYSTSALAWQGRYVGSFYRTEGIGEESITRHVYDARTTSVTPGGMDLDLGFNLTFRSNPGASGTSLLRSRINGGLAKGIFRLRGLFVPWQDVAPGSVAPRERQVQIGMDVTPRRGPALRLDWNNHARASLAGRSSVLDGRAALSYRLGPVGAVTSFRRVETDVQEGRGAPSTTDEWRGGLSASRSFGRVALSGGYEALVSHYQILELRRDFTSHRAEASGGWTPLRRVSVSGSTVLYWTRTVGNEPTGPIPYEEQSVTGRVGYVPLTGLSLEAVREYRNQNAVSGGGATDYLQLQAQLRRPVWRNILFHTGAFQTLDLKRGAAPANSAFLSVEGDVRAGIHARGEVSASRPAAARGSGPVNWYRHVDLRLLPEPRVRLETRWSHRSVSRPEGNGQNDKDLELVLGYEPETNVNGWISHRILWGEGRVGRREYLTTLNATYTFLRDTRLSADWSRRQSTISGIRSATSTGGVDLTFWLPQRFRTQVSWRRNGAYQGAVSSTYGLSVDKNF